VLFRSGKMKYKNEMNHSAPPPRSMSNDCHGIEVNCNMPSCRWCGF